MMVQTIQGEHTAMHVLYYTNSNTNDSEIICIIIIMTVCSTCSSCERFCSDTVDVNSYYSGATEFNLDLDSVGVKPVLPAVERW